MNVGRISLVAGIVPGLPGFRLVAPAIRVRGFVHRLRGSPSEAYSYSGAILAALGEAMERMRAEAGDDQLAA